MTAKKKLPNDKATTMISLLCVLLFTRFNAVNTEQLSNDKYGTFTNASTGLTLYVCKHNKKRTFWSVVRAADLFGNHLIGNGYYTKSDSESDCEGSSSLITNSDCYFQINGVYSGCNPSTFESWADLNVLFSFTFNEQTIEYNFLKESNEIVGNQDWNGYHCAIPWRDDVQEQDSYPLAFVTAPFSWSTEGERDVEVYVDGDSGCWGYVKENGDSGTFYGDIFNRQIAWNGALYLHEWSDTGLSDQSDACATGSQISVRVDRDVLFIAFQCSNGLTGDSLLLFATNAFSACPVVSP